MAEQVIVPFDPDPQKRLRIVHCAGCEAYEAQTRAMADQREADELEMRKMRRRISHLESEAKRKLREHEQYDVALEIFQYWVKVTGRTSRTLFGPKRQKLVIQALSLLRERYNDDEDHPARALCCAILGCARNGYVDDRGKRHDGIELICRDDDMLDKNIVRYREYMATKGEEPIV